MTDRNHNDFENLFDDAAQRMHRDMPRGNGPSAKVWQSVLGDKDDAINAAVDNHASQSDPPVHRATPTRQPGGSQVQPKGNHARPDYMRWASLAAMIAIVATMGFGYYQISGDQPDDEYQFVAMAPGTPELVSSMQDEISSPAASPFAQIYDPEFACKAEPLSEEVVYQMVIDPFQFDREQPIASPSSARTPYGWETDGRYLETRDWIFATREQMLPMGNPTMREQLAATANEFWNCLMTGSALQVWAMMDPIAVQHEILTYLPVIRDEAMVRKFIQEWGPRRYSAGLTMVFPDLGNMDQYDASKHADLSWESVRVTDGPSDSGSRRRAEVLMIPHEGSTSTWSVMLVLRLAPDGTWWVTTFYGVE